METTKNTAVGIVGTGYSFMGMPFDVWAAALTALYMAVCIVDKLFPAFFPTVKAKVKSLFKRK